MEIVNRRARASLERITANSVSLALLPRNRLLGLLHSGHRRYNFLLVWHPSSTRCLQSSTPGSPVRRLLAILSRRRHLVRRGRSALPHRSTTGMVETGAQVTGVVDWHIQPSWRNRMDAKCEFRVLFGELVLVSERFELGLGEYCVYHWQLVALV